MLNNFFITILICAGIVVLFSFLSIAACLLAILTLFILFMIFSLPPVVILVIIFFSFFLPVTRYFLEKARKIYLFNPQIYPRDYSRELSWIWRPYF